MLASSWLLPETSRTPHCSFPGSGREGMRGNWAIIVGPQRNKISLSASPQLVWTDKVSGANGKHKRTLWCSKYLLLCVLLSWGFPESCLIFSSDTRSEWKTKWAEKLQAENTNYVYKCVHVTLDMNRRKFTTLSSDGNRVKVYCLQAWGLGRKMQRQFTRAHKVLAAGRGVAAGGQEEFFRYRCSGCCTNRISFKKQS